MTVSPRLQHLLTSESARYRLIPHGARSRACDVAEAAAVPGRQFAKVVVLRDAAGAYLMVVVPSTTHVRLESVQRLTGRQGLRLVSEAELRSLFPDCEPGAMPPFGALYGVPVYMDGCFREQPEFFFRGGAHDESIAMLVADYESLARPVFGQWCFHDPPRAPLRAPRAAAVPAAPGRKGRAMRCREVMNKNVVVCEEGESVAACARLMRDRAIGFLPVVDGGGQVVGVLTDRDLTLRVLAEEREPETPVRAVMTRDVRICRPWDSLREAERKMAAVRKSRLVVADEDGCCAGVISLSDIAQADTRALAGHVLYEITQREARPAPRTGA